jgi:hypothetical protein
MRNLREPVPGPQAFVLVFSGVVFGIAQHWAGDISLIEMLLLLGLVSFVFQPVSILIHELGHGIAACHVGGGPAAIMVGRGPWLQLSAGQIRVNFSFLPTRGVMIGGVCRYEGETASWRSRALVALAGPAATLIQLLAGLALAAVIWPHSGAFVRNLIVLSLVGLIGSLIVNLSPMKVSRGGNAVVVGTDGTRARLAWRLHRDGAPPAASRSSTPLTGMVGSAPAVERELEGARAASSAPPPPQRSGS